jgi:sec-independent protein translocase protein TatA
MWGQLLTPTHLLVVAAVALLVFGPRRLPELGEGLGKSIRAFRDATAGQEDGETSSPHPAPVPRDR